MKEQETFQTIEVAHMLQVTGTTVRRYCQEFSEHLSEGTRRKRRIYSSADIATLKRVQQLAGEGFTKAEINRLLYTEPTPEEPQTSALALYPELAQFIEQARQKQTELQDRLDTLEGEVRELRQAAARPWWEKLFKRS